MHLSSSVRICPTTDIHLQVAVRIADAWHVRVGEQKVISDGQEGQVLHESKVLPVHDDLVESVG